MSIHSLLKTSAALGALVALTASATAQETTTITVGTVNNSDMIRMQGLTSVFEEQHPNIKVNWVTLEENILRQRVTTDIATKGGQFDVMTIGTYEVPIWAKQEWLQPLDNLPETYNTDDLIPAIRNALSVDDKLYALPFYAESVLTLYRKDLFEKAGLEMPEQPTWDFIAEAAEKTADKENGVYGICLRGKPGWGENMAFLGNMAREFGANYFDASWQPQFESEGWKKAVNLYVELMTKYGPPGAASNGFNENLSLFGQGKCAMWIDASVAASFVTNPEQSQVADQVGFGGAPCGTEDCPNDGYNWQWAWSLGLPAGSQKAEAAQEFVAWATSQDYINLVAEREGWASVPPGTRTSLYENKEYTDAAPFAAATLNAIQNAKAEPTDDKPYFGLQFAAIPEFQGIGTAVGQQMAAALSGSVTADQALSQAQAIATREMTRGGYLK
ncbi:sugar ABC transporter substrate-binding protein [Fulvimarina endophytica]|uniref:Sugar ABC transporter substrate-binding protein n=1 Tax=Fulvimarina endophytica TaxID=2293836 RepID=A0A371X297_9HYPH|nr:sugar ABC transporter substrate-binding protein [Fulvimarina endophytica]RFC63351.1 sugar ABC transporter substrate-binding protein [Fulvimarina endophytica]